jgi:hypothetical protein
MLNEQVARDDDPIEFTFELLAMQESLSFTAIAGMPLAGFMGQVREHKRDFERFRKDLDDRWKEIVGQDERIDGQIAGFRVQILEMFKQAAADARGWAPKLESGIRTAMVGWEKKEEPSPDLSLAPGLRTAYDTVHMLQTTLDEITRSALALYSNEQTIHTMFGSSRERLKEHLDKVNRKTVDRAWVEACTATRDAANTYPTDGQKEDLRTLADKAITMSEPMVAEFNDVFDDFYEHSRRCSRLRPIRSRSVKRSRSTASPTTSANGSRPSSSRASPACRKRSARWIGASSSASGFSSSTCPGV